MIEQKVFNKVLEFFQKKNNNYEVIDFIADVSEMIIWYLDADFKILYVSSYIEKIIDINPQIMINQSLKLFIRPEVWNAVLHEKEKILTGKKQNPDDLIYFEFLHEKESGDKIWLLISVKPVFDNGKLVSMVCVGKDITHVKIYQQLEHEKHDLYENMFHFSQSILFVLDPLEFKIFDLNLEAMKYLEISNQTDLVEFKQVCNKFPVLMNRYHDEFKRENQVSFNIALFTKSKKIKTARAFVSKLTVFPDIIKDYTEKPEYLIQVVLKDITEKNKAKKDLNQLLQRYITFFDFSPISLWEVDFSLIFVYINSLQIPEQIEFKEYIKNAPEIFTTTLSLLIINKVNKHTLELYHVKTFEEFMSNILIFRNPESIENFISMMDAFYHKKTFFEGETVHERHDGSRLRLIIRWSVINKFENLPIKAIISLIDITEKHIYYSKLLEKTFELRKLNDELKKAIEKEQQLALQANVSNDVKTRFLATMSHELRTPLNGIQGMTQLLLNTQINEEQREFLNILNDSTSNIITLVNDIFDYVKLEDKNIQFAKNSFSLFDICMSVLSNYSSKAFEKNLEIIVDWNFSVPDFVIGDMTRFKQALNNLVDNAVKFTSKGFIMLSLKSIEKMSVENNQETQLKYHFSISNSVKTIKSEDKDKLFKTFSQLDNSLSRKHSGTGLGLAIVKQILSIMNGAIEYIEREDEITQFDFNACFGNSGDLFIRLPEIKTEEPLNILIIKKHKIFSYNLKKYFPEDNITINEYTYEEINENLLNTLSTIKTDFVVCDANMLTKGFASRAIIEKLNEVFNSQLIVLYRNKDIVDTDGFTKTLKLFKPLNIVDFKNLIKKNI